MEREQKILEEIKNPVSPLYLHSLLDSLVNLYEESSRVPKTPWIEEFLEKCFLFRLSNLF